MNYRDFKTAVALDANEPRDYEQIVFRTPDGINYHNVTIDFGYWNNSKDKAMIVNLFNIKPKFHVGDVVTNISGLYPSVTPTIKEVDILNQCYRYKEIGGVTWFKEQDKLKLVDNKPIFKVGDKVKGASSEEPEKEFIINSINEDIKCYHYFNGNGIITMFKDQHKLTLVQTDNCRHPVEGETKFAESILAAVKAVKTTKLKGSITFNIPKNIDTFKVGYILSGNNDLKIDAEISNNDTDIIIVKW